MPFLLACQLARSVSFFFVYLRRWFFYFSQDNPNPENPPFLSETGFFWGVLHPLGVVILGYAFIWFAVDGWSLPRTCCLLFGTKVHRPLTGSTRLRTRGAFFFLELTSPDNPFLFFAPAYLGFLHLDFKLEVLLTPQRRAAPAPHIGCSTSSSRFRRSFS